METGRAFKHTVLTLMRKPFILIFFGALALAYLTVNSMNPILPLLSGFYRITSGSVFDSIISMLQILIEPRVIVTVLVVMLLISVVLALASGLLLSGYFNVIHQSLEGSIPGKEQFAAGLKKYFRKVATASFCLFLSGLAFAVFAAVAAVPAIVITRAASAGKPDFILAAVFVDVLTAGVLFLGSMFYRAYMFFWFPAIIRGGEKPFKKARQVVNGHFWGILCRFLVFDILFVAAQYAISHMEVGAAAFALNWVFITLFFGILVTYVFALNKEWMNSL